MVNGTSVWIGIWPVDLTRWGMLLYNCREDTYSSCMYVMEALVPYPCHVTYETTSRHRLEDNLNSNEYVVKRIAHFGGFPGLLHLRKEVRLFSHIPHKSARLHINTSPSTKSSLVGLYCFQGNLLSEGERIGWGEGKSRQNAGKQDSRVEGF